MSTRHSLPLTPRTLQQEAPPTHLARLQQLLHRQEVRIPPPILVHGKHDALLQRDVVQLLALRGRNAHGLLDEDVLARGERLLGEGEVRVVGCADHDLLSAQSARGVVDARRRRTRSTSWSATTSSNDEATLIPSPQISLARPLPDRSTTV